MKFHSGVLFFFNVVLFAFISLDGFGFWSTIPVKNNISIVV